MQSLEIKKRILEATKKIQDFQVILILWHGDGTYHAELEEGEEVINNYIEIYDNCNNNIYSEGFGKEDATTKDIDLLKAEQKKMYNYLKKHFNNVIKKDMNI